ncbi:MAG: hypothetical protein JST64_02290, partial [Actinobacteria bacterium]|nr:hypothetical protein [Actinomycetota bacterium]
MADRVVVRSRTRAGAVPHSEQTGPGHSPSWIARMSPRPATTGPTVRLGILWFFVALAAVTAGRWPTAVLWGMTSAVAAREIVVAWWGAPGDRSATGRRPPGVVVASVVVLTVLTPAAAALGVGFAGGILLLVGIALAIVAAASRTSLVELTPSDAAALAIAVLLPTLPSATVVLLTAGDVWAGIFLVLAVSMYDAGYHIGAAETSSLLEGPVTGIVG